jgi:cytochrome d ubiquinol oxidase subunit II
VTILFTAFPKAFALISTQLHIPLSLMLIGIVLRGSAFAFRTNDVVPRTVSEVGAQKFWERIFAASSLFTPMMLGMTIGAVASGRLAGQGGTFIEVFVRPWAAPFCFAVGLLALTLFAFLAAVYLLLEADEAALRDDFRQRALWAGGVGVLLAGAVFLLANSGAPYVRYHLGHTTWGAMTMGLAGFSALAALTSLWQRRYRIAFVCTVSYVMFIVWGWGVSQYPYLVIPSVTITDSAPIQTLQLVLAAVLIGALLLFPSLYYLYRIFKGGTIRRALE